MAEENSVLPFQIRTPIMNWSRCKPPSQVHACECGSDIVEKMADGLVTRYRCGDCQTGLGDLTMGHEP